MPRHKRPRDSAENIAKLQKVDGILPDEIWVEILKKLAHSSRLDTAMVSKNFAKLTTEASFEAVDTNQKLQEEFAKILNSFQEEIPPFKKSVAGLKHFLTKVIEEKLNNDKTLTIDDAHLMIVTTLNNLAPLSQPPYTSFTKDVISQFTAETITQYLPEMPGLLRILANDLQYALSNNLLNDPQSASYNEYIQFRNTLTLLFDALEKYATANQGYFPGLSVEDTFAIIGMITLLQDPDEYTLNIDFEKILLGRLHLVSPEDFFEKTTLDPQYFDLLSQEFIDNDEIYTAFETGAATVRERDSHNSSSYTP